MLKKIENLIHKQRQSSISSSSTASSQGSINSGKGWNIFRQAIAQKDNALPQFESPALENMKMDLNLNKLNSRLLNSISGKSSSSMEAPSNLAYDSYQGLLATSNEPGMIQIFDLQGERKQRIRSLDKNIYTIIKFYQNRPYLIALDKLNQIFLINYQTNEIQKINKPKSMDENEKFIVLYIPDFYTGVDANEDYAFFGTNFGQVFVFQQSQKQFISFIKSPNKNITQITDIKSNHKKPHRLLISYQNMETSSSMVVVHSFYKNKEVQRLEFNPTSHQELGKVLTASYNHEANRICIVFSSGKVQIFKAQSKIQEGRIRPLQQLELDNLSELKFARISWRNVTDSKRQCCLIFYSYQVKHQEQREIAIFLGQKGTKGSTLFQKTQFLNQLQDQTEETIQDCIYIDIMIPNMNQAITENIGQRYLRNKKQSLLKVRSNKQKMVKSQLILAISSSSKLFYYDPNNFPTEENQSNFQNFLPLELNYLQSNTIKYQQLMQLSQISNSKRNDFVEFLELMGKSQEIEKLYMITKNDQRFIKAIEKKEKSKYSTCSELYQYLTKILMKVQNAEAVLAYHIAVDIQQNLIIRRITQQKSTQILCINLQEHIQDEKITQLIVDAENQMIQISTSGSDVFEIKMTQGLFIREKEKLEIPQIDIQKQNLKDQESSERLTIFKQVDHNSKQKLMILGFNNGRVKIINTKSYKVIFNVRCMNDENAITTLETVKSSSGESTSIYIGTGSGHLLHIQINSKETKIIKSKQLSIFKIRQLIVSDNNMIYAISDKQLFCVEKQSFNIKYKYELNSKELSKKEVFKSFSLMKLNESQSSIVCFLQKSKWILMFDLQTLICYCVYDLKKIGFNPSFVHILNDLNQTILVSSQNLETHIFTLKKQIEFPQDIDLYENCIFDEELAEQKFPKTQKKSAITQIFHKNITIQKCINKQITNEIKSKKRSHSLGATLLKSDVETLNLLNIRQSACNVVSDGEESDESPRLRKKQIQQIEAQREQRVKKGYAILSRVNNKPKKILEEIKEEEAKKQKRNSMDKDKNKQNEESEPKLRRAISTNKRRKSHWV
ncbi:UNKNOWN [Stylonychia lemnae]|uniref:Uncharacterized protein n=1 Tax=Stylonychia lemnae TaxID=5949 RepID=A0A078ATN2_STYLE|nr:UNKNOWN [Stylonychia lemnae]|eukprot:CDW85599.1 UNKNOWN [Stylonychia lemnae]